MTTQVPFTLRGRIPSRVEDEHGTERQKTMEVA